MGTSDKDLKGKEQNLPTDDGDLNGSTKLPQSFKQSSSKESNIDWFTELGDETTMKSGILSKDQYFHLCNDVKACIDSLLSEDKTLAFVTISKLFKSFRSAFSCSQKLKNKVYELESEKRLREKWHASVSDEIRSRNEKIKYLEDHLVESEIRRTEAEKSLQEIQSRMEEMRKKSEESNDNSEFVEDILSIKHTQKNHETHSDSHPETTRATHTTPHYMDQKEKFDKKMHQAESENHELLSQIYTLQENLKSEIQKKIQGQVLISKRDKEIQKHQTVVDSFKENIQLLKFDLETSNSQYRSIMSDLKQCKKKLCDASNTIDTLKISISGQKFHLMTTKTKKAAIEKELQKKKEDVHFLQGEFDKSIKLQSDLETKVHVQEQKIAELKVSYEKRSEEFTSQNVEFQELLKQEANKDEVIDKSKKEVQKLVDELKQVNKELKDKTTNLNVQEQVNNKTELRVESLTRYTSELESKLKSQEAKKEELDIQVIHLTNTVSELRNQVNSLDYRDRLEQEEVIKLKKELKKEKYFRDSLRDSERSVRRQLEGTKMKLKETKQLHQAFTDSSKKQIEQIKNFEDEVKTLRRQIAVLTGENNNLSYSLEQFRKRNQELYDEVQSKDKECFRTLEALGEKNHELEMAEQKLQRLMEQKIAVECKVAEKDKEIAKKNDDIAFLEKDMLSSKKDMGLKLEEIKILETEIGLLNHSIGVMKKQLCGAKYLKQDINKVRSLFEKEQLKTKSLEHALQKPMNMHRWRLLEGSDPDADQLLRKNIIFQRELTKKTDSLTMMAADLKQKEDTISVLREDLGRRISEDSAACKTQLEDAKRRLKSLVAEREVCEVMFGKYRNEIVKLKNEVRELKLENRSRESSLRGHV